MNEDSRNSGFDDIDIDEMLIDSGDTYKSLHHKLTPQDNNEIIEEEDEHDR